jgi:hypothetical protein
MYKPHPNVVTLHRLPQGVSKLLPRGHLTEPCIGGCEPWLWAALNVHLNEVVKKTVEGRAKVRRCRLTLSNPI